ncbi:uncharacterized protein LOC131886822 [Tigriopus californicus]|uniref:uncharacterized protein LOC131886822 n=1 Tax=Tigriopus californicus TaxID=6832 RepID=UPI0027DA3D72|nr:uncharacterized protein LOC131886822 [Tigriopus californicus]
MPKTKKRGRAGKGEKETPLLTVQGILRLDKTFVPPRHEDADTLLIQRQPDGPAECIRLIPGQSEHEMVEYKAGYDVGPSNPFPQNEAEQKLFQDRQKADQVQAAFADLQKQSWDEKQAREAQFQRDEHNRQRAIRGLSPLAPDIEIPSTHADPAHPGNYFPPADGPLRDSERVLPPGEEASVDQREEEAKTDVIPPEKTVTEAELPGEERQNLPEERLPQMKPLPSKEAGPSPEMGVREMALQVALALEEERKKAAQASQDDQSVIYSLDELTAMKMKPVQGPEVTVESVVQQRTEENNKAVLDAYWQFVRENPQDFNGWTYLLQHVENMADLNEVRSAYNAFLPLYPYCFAYWERYCDIEKRAEQWERALAILHRGLEAIPMSVDLWLAYLELYRKMYEKLDNFDEIFRIQWEKAVMTVGLEYRSDSLWERIIEWESARNNLREVTHAYKRLISVPTKLYNKHWDNFIAHVRDHHPRDILFYDEYEALRKVTCEELDLTYRPDPIIEPVKPREVIQPEDKLKAGMKERIVASVVSQHEWVEEAVDKRFRFEEKIKRPYFHVKAMDLKQLKNWDAYLDFEIGEKDHERIVALFERCLIPCAQYEQFWEKYATYMEKHHKSQKGRSKSAHGAQDSSKSALSKAKWAFDTGLETVQKIRDKRCTWTLRGWMEFDDEGHAVMKAAEISEKNKGGKTIVQEHDAKTTLETPVEGDEATPSDAQSAQDTIDNEMSLVLKTSWENQGKQAVRDIYKRACIVHCRKKALIKMKWAAFEEEAGDSVKAREILLELNQRYPLLLECCFQVIDIDRRLGEFDKAEEHYKVLMSKIPTNRRNIKTWVAMKLARFQFKVCGSTEKALSTLRSALKREKGEPTLYSQIIDVCYQRHPIDVKGVTAAIELAIKSNELSNMQKLGFVKRKLEFMQEFGDIRRLREAQDQLKQFRKLCANDLKLEQKRKKELEKEQVKLEELEKFRAQTRADVNLKAKIAEAEGRLLCTGCHTAMYPDEQGIYEFEKPRRSRLEAQNPAESSYPSDNANGTAEDGVVDLMDMVISSEQEENIKRTLEEKTKYKEVAPTWELNIETYGYGRKRKTYDPDYEHIESAKFKEYERLEITGYDESIKDEDRDKLKRISAPGLGLDGKTKKAKMPSAEPLTTSDYIVPPKVPQLMLGPSVGPRKPESAPGSEKEEEISAFELPPEIANPQKSPCVNVPEWFVKEGGELCLSDTDNGMSVIRYWPKFLSDKGNHLMFNRLRRYCKWHQKQRQIGGEWKYETRLVAWYGPCDYVHSGLKLEKNLNWAPELLDLLHRLIAMTKHEFNACFLNLYRHGHDMCGWHSDTHPQLGRNPPVASVSLGGVRVFELRKKTGAPNFIRFPLFPGSLLVMEGATQEDWLHCLPRDPNCAQERINLTFRTMYSIDKRK